MVEAEVGIDADLMRQGRQECQEVSEMVPKKEQEPAMSSWRSAGASGGGYGYYGYAPLTKGPDYRKVHMHIFEKLWMGWMSRAQATA